MYRMIGFCLMSLPLFGCARSDAAVTENTAPAEVADVEEGRPGLARLNPNPTKAYWLTLRISNAPGEFKYVKAGAQYDVVNESECGSVHPVTGTPSRITSQEDVALTRVSATEFTGVLYADYMQDEDLYGRGACRWELTGASARMKATGAHEETRFTIFTSAEDMASGTRYTRYYAKHLYPRARPTVDYPDLPWRDNHPATGYDQPDVLVPAVRATAFSVTVSAVEFVP